MKRSLLAAGLWRRLTRVWQRRLTGTGKVFVVLLFVSLPSLTVTDSGLLLLSAALFAGLLVAAGIGWLVRPRLDIVVQPMARLMRGEPARIDAQIHNVGRAACFRVHLQWQDTPSHWGLQRETVVIGHLRRGEIRRFTLPVWPARRGSSAWPPVEAVSSFPLHLVRFCQSFELPGAVSVYPRYRRLRNHCLVNAVNTSVAPPHSSVSPHARIGYSGDYLGNREYQAGLFVRRWDFRSWARLGRPIVREYAEPEVHQIAVLVDTFAPWRARGGTDERFERVLSLAASVCDTLHAGGFCITSVALGREIIDLATIGVRDSMSRILDRLSDLSPSPISALEGWLPSVRCVLQPSLPVIVVLSDVDQERLRMAHEVRWISGRATVLCAGEPGGYGGEVAGAVCTVPCGEFLETTNPAR